MGAEYDSLKAAQYSLLGLEFQAKNPIWSKTSLTSGKEQGVACTYRKLSLLQRILSLWLVAPHQSTPCPV
jgi:hypothetical protein